jgi:L-fuconolactonase
VSVNSRPPYMGSMPRSVEAIKEWHARSLGEEVLDREMPIVDAHHHLFGEASSAHHYRIQDLERDIAGGHRIIGTIYVEAYQSGWRHAGPEALRPVGEVEMIVGLTGTPISSMQGSCQVAAGIVSNADLTLGDGVAKVLAAQMEAGQGRLRGVRHHAAYDDGLVGRFIKHPPKPHLLLDPAFRKGLAQLPRWDLSFDAWIYHHQINELIDLADAFPQIPIVLNHVGGVIGVGEFEAQRSRVLTEWATDLRNLAARPNVRVKIGGMGMLVFGFGFEHQPRPATSAALARAWRPLIDLCLDAFGPHRCMFESNFPVDKQSCGYTELWNAFKLATRSLSLDERRALFYRTACRTYHLTDLEHAADRMSAE